jgi:hypothetical protein
MTESSMPIPKLAQFLNNFHKNQKKDNYETFSLPFHSIPGPVIFRMC